MDRQMIRTEPDAHRGRQADRVGTTDGADREEAARPTSPEPTAPVRPTGAGRPSSPVTTLRGAGVDVDVGRVVPFVVGACLVGLVVAIGVLTVAGFQKNDQVNRLHHQGVLVEARVSGCVGLLGGSGSNLVGYDCRASFTLDGHRYDEPLAGSTAPVPGARFRAVTVPGDPALFATVATVAAERASWRVFILPAVLLLVLLSAVAALIVVRARRRPAGAAIRR